MTARPEQGNVQSMEAGNTYTPDLRHNDGPDDHFRLLKTTGPTATARLPVLWISMPCFNRYCGAAIFAR